MADIAEIHSNYSIPVEEKKAIYFSKYFSEWFHKGQTRNYIILKPRAAGLQQQVPTSI